MGHLKLHLLRFPLNSKKDRENRGGGEMCHYPWTSVNTFKLKKKMEL